MSNMGIFGPILCLLCLYCFSVIQIPIGIFGGFVQFLRALCESDPFEYEEKISSSKNWFLSGIPFCGPLIAFNRVMKIDSTKKPERMNVQIKVSDNNV